jgi:hypothetical protein
MATSDGARSLDRARELVRGRIGHADSLEEHLVMPAELDGRVLDPLDRNRETLKRIPPIEPSSSLRDGHATSPSRRHLDLGTRLGIRVSAADGSSQNRGWNAVIWLRFTSAAGCHAHRLARPSCGLSRGQQAVCGSVFSIECLLYRRSLRSAQGAAALAHPRVLHPECRVLREVRQGRRGPGRVIGCRRSAGVARGVRGGYGFRRRRARVGTGCAGSW